MPRGTPEQLKAQRAYADARRRAYFTALTESAARRRCLSSNIPPIQASGFEESIDKRSAAAVRRVVEYISNSLKVQGAHSEYKDGAALEDYVPVERPGPKESKASHDDAEQVPEAPRNGTGHRRRGHPWAV
jgi:hypothetical protein